MKWLKDYELGIGAIDEQHKRIVDYINELEKANGLRNDGYISFVLDALVEYTLTHFEFEEGLQAKANYPYLKAHKRIHAIFIKRVESFRVRHKGGEDITEELVFMLKTWLASHIKGDDKDYGELVRRHMEQDPHWMQEGLPQPPQTPQPAQRAA